MTSNKDHFCVCVTSDDISSADLERLRSQRAAILKSAQWQLGQVITIRFLEVAPKLQNRVRDVAMEWTKIADLNFDFRKNAPTNIRIAFQPGKGSWSYLGTVCETIPEPQPTMNYGWLTPESSDDDVRRVVLHEFGHAIGLIHEHQNPKKGIMWNRDAVVKDLKGPPNFWDEAKIETNIFKKYPESGVIASDSDSESIMMYPIPKAWTLDGFSAGLNKDISTQDKQLVATVYPK